MSIETMTKLATVTVGSGGSSSIEFTNIPQTYTDLKIVVSHRTDRASFLVSDTKIQFNNETTGTNYSARRIYGDGSSATSDSYPNQSRGFWGYSSGATSTASTFSNTEIYIPNYLSSNYKSYSVDSVHETNGTTAYTFLIAGLWTNTSPITSILLSDPNNANFVQHTTATLYGIKNARKTAGNSIKATGGNISFDGTYVVHTFTSSGTFTPTQNLRADYLVVAGGGAGGYIDPDGTVAGGGGAGGLRSTVTATGGGGSLESALSLYANTNYSVTVGAGGAGGTSSANGSDSAFWTVTSTGGGRGRGDSAVGNGGSGGGGSSDNATGGTGTSNQGFAGGTGYQSHPQYLGGGGGGASAVGASASLSTPAAGGAGVSVAITGSSVTYAGGGGGAVRNANGTTFLGGAGGSGGGGAGGGETARGDGDSTTALARSGRAGTANTGGGGGGNHSFSGTAGSGGSGIVIIRYKA